MYRGLSQKESGQATIMNMDSELERIKVEWNV